MPLFRIISDQIMEAETQDDWKKDNKALRSVLFITKFTKNLG